MDEEKIRIEAMVQAMHYANISRGGVMGIEDIIKTASKIADFIRNSNTGDK